MNIAVLYTGGTIGCVGNPLSPMDATAFSNAFASLVAPVLRQRYPGLQLDFPPIAFPESASGTLDSTNLQPADWCIMAAAVLDNYPSYDGFVVLHGTDSMDFTAPALSFLLSDCAADGTPTISLSKPVIVTGSQLPLFHQENASGPPALNFNSDAFQNVCGAVASALSGVPEVAVYFDAVLYRGNRVVKTNASQFDAFGSPNFPALGRIGVATDIDLARALPGPSSPEASVDANLGVLQQRLAYLSAHLDDFPVVQLNAIPAAYSAPGGTAVLATLIDAWVGAGIKGLVLQSYGEGNFPSGNPDEPSSGANYRALARATAAGVLLVDCTQVISGTVDDDAYAAGAWLPAVGALNPQDMTPMAALAKLTILACVANYRGWSADIVKTLMQTNLVGEMLSANRLDRWSRRCLGSGQSIDALDGSATLVNDPVLGPLLRPCDGGAPLWRALDVAITNPPGRLALASDGSLAFIDRLGQVLWKAEAPPGLQVADALTLDGSYAAGDLRLTVHYDGARNDVLRLYAQTVP
jgi:L-asparaginase